jgi:hypothetical protein
LHKVLYIVNIGLNDDFETQKPAFSKALEEYGIFNLLKQVITHSSPRRLVEGKKRVPAIIIKQQFGLLKS